MTTKNSIKITVQNTIKNSDYDISISAEWMGLNNKVKAKGSSITTRFNNLKNGTYQIYVVGPCHRAQGSVLCENNSTSTATIKLPIGKGTINVKVFGDGLNVAVWKNINFLLTKCGQEKDLVVPMKKKGNYDCEGNKKIVVDVGFWRVLFLENLVTSTEFVELTVQKNKTHNVMFTVSLIR